jgi:putative oxygen-independent coproporphyrinogen III oxidase
VVRDRGRSGEQAALANAIVADMEAQAARLGARQLASIFFGGGTPSLMPPDQVARVIERARALFPGGGEIEITLEANPTDAEAARFAALARAGVNRLSLGVQSLDDDALRFLGRNHSAAEAMRALELARAAFDRLSIDLIYARPGQTVAHWTNELNRAVDMGFEHVSPYQLTIEPTTAFGRAFARGTLVPPDEDLAADLYETTQAVLEARSFDAYEVSNHARGEAARSAHNLHVWRSGDYVGVGPGAHGRLTLDGVRTATVARRGVTDYLAGVAAGRPWSEDQRLSPLEADEERLLLGLRTTEGVSVDLINRMDLGERIRDLQEGGRLTVTDGRVAASPEGRPVLDALLRVLLT